MTLQPPLKYADGVAAWGSLSEVGVLCLSRRNSAALKRIFGTEELVFEELFVSRPHVFLGKRHPSAEAKAIRVGLLRQKEVGLSRLDTQFAAAIRDRVTACER